MQTDDRAITPVQAAVYGAAAGFAATVLMSGLARLPGIRQQIDRTSPVERAIAETEGQDNFAPMSPAMALVQASGPGPEGPAGLFAAKVASGLFGRDLGKQTERWGRLVHLIYGSFWGLVYGVCQSDRPRDPVVSGASHGMAVWAVGPGLLVPAMRILPAPSKTPPKQAALGVAAHITYGIALATVFRRLMNR